MTQNEKQRHFTGMGRNKSIRKMVSFGALGRRGVLFYRLDPGGWGIMKHELSKREKQVSEIHNGLIVFSDKLKRQYGQRWKAREKKSLSIITYREKTI